MTEDEIYKLRMYQADELMWSRVEDELPKDSGLVLTFDKISVWCAIYFHDTNKFESLEGDRYGESWEIKNISHWMPLPEPPQEWNTHD